MSFENLLESSCFGRSYIHFQFPRISVKEIILCAEIRIFQRHVRLYYVIQLLSIQIAKSLSVFYIQRNIQLIINSTEKQKHSFTSGIIISTNLIFSAV